MDDRVRVGLVGAGPWAEYFHAPMLSRGPGTQLAGVWTRRREAAERLARAHGTVAFHSFDELLDHCDAVAFSVPPQVQVELGVAAAQRGKAILLEKPLAADLASAEEFASAVNRAGSTSQVMFTWRYAEQGRAALAAMPSARVIGARGAFVLGSLLGGPYATPWRLEGGGVLDLAPHLLDYLDAALGPITSISGHGDRIKWAGFLIDHEGGAVSDVSISASTPLEPMLAGVQIYTETGVVSFDANSWSTESSWSTVATEFAQTARGVPHPLDVNRGLYVQRLVERAESVLS